MLIDDCVHLLLRINLISIVGIDWNFMRPWYFIQYIKNV